MIPDTLKSLAVPIDSLRPYAKNPRNGDLEAIKESLRLNQQYRPIVVNRRDNTILAGNHTYFAALELGWEEIAATFVDADEEQAARIVLVDNRTNDLAWNDDAMIAEILQELPSVEGTGYTDEALDELLAGIEARENEGLADPDEVPDPPEEPVTKRGDVWLLGRHRVMCGDSTSATDVERLMSGRVAALMVTDPPYGVDYHGGMKRWEGIANDGRGDAALEEFLVEAFATAYSFCGNDVGWYVWHGGLVAVPVHRALERVGRKPSAQIVWVKNVMAAGWGDYRFRHECCYYSKGAFYAGRDQDTVWETPRERGYEHPTQKPVELAERAINNSSKDGDAVLDLFGGSGSTLIAAEKTNRTCYMMELSEQYVDVICRRYQQYTGTLPVLEATGEEHDFTA